MSKKTRAAFWRAGQYALLSIMLFLLLFPIYWMINTSFKEVGEVRIFATDLLAEEFYFPELHRNVSTLAVWLNLCQYRNHCRPVCPGGNRRGGDGRLWL